MRRQGDMIWLSSEAGKDSSDLDGISGWDGERLGNRERPGTRGFAHSVMCPEHNSRAFSRRRWSSRGGIPSSLLFKLRERERLGCPIHGKLLLRSRGSTPHL